MAVYAIADLHLAHSVDKPMDVFGSEWNHHIQRIENYWREQVTDDDVVLVPGDISWAMTLAEAQADLSFIGRLPGKKVLLKGNHDYWWSGISKVRAALAPGTYALQNDSLTLDGVTIVGARGWVLPSHPKSTPEDEAIYLREIGRLKLSLENARNRPGPRIAMMHYPPYGPDGAPTPFTELLAEHNVDVCVYGHLHGPAHKYAFEGSIQGVRYVLVSADFTQFRPVRIY